MNYTELAEKLIGSLKSSTKDTIIDELIELGRQNVFIPVMIEYVKLAKQSANRGLIDDMISCIDSAYSPGLRAHILDDFIQAELQIKSKLNELKAKHQIYVLEQKLFMYHEVEQLLRSTATTGTTMAIMKILDFRGECTD